MKYKAIKEKVKQLAENEANKSALRQAICDLLRQEVSHYDWVGFYFHNDNNELILHEFSGTPTEHTTIPFGKGICGQVALSNKSFLVQDVTEQDNYISCGLAVKSELVVPVFKAGKNIGQLDIDSHSLAPFTKEDEGLLAYINHFVSK